MDLIERQAAIDELGYCQTYLFDSRDKDKKISLEDAEYAIEQLPSAQSKKFSEVLQDMMDEDYYLFCHTGYSRLAEKDWEWLIEQVKEMEQKGRTDGNGRD